MWRPRRAAPHVALSPPLPARPRAADRDGDGHIDPDELSTVMGRMGMQPTDAQLKELIESVDFDNNGKIEFEEFATLMARRMLISDGDYELKQAFKIFDADESGKLDVAEVRAMFTHNNNPFNPQARPPAAPARPPCPPLPPACRLARAARLARRPSARDALPSTAHPLILPPPQSLEPYEIDELVRLADPDGNGWVTLDEFVNMPCWQLPPLPARQRKMPRRPSANPGAGAGNTSAADAASPAS